MTVLASSSAGNLRGVAPSLWTWLGIHVAWVSAAGVFLWAHPKDGLAWVVLVWGPWGLGLAQAVALWRRLPTWAVALWPVATGLGFVLSMALAWFTYVAMGLCLGLCQAALLAAGRFRGGWLWPLASGLSWGSALLAWGSIAPYLAPSHPQAGSIDPLGYAQSVLVYALGTGWALRWMARRPAQAG